MSHNYDFNSGGLKLTTENCIRITKVAKSLKIKVLEDICLNFIMKSIEPVQNELSNYIPKNHQQEPRNIHSQGNQLQIF